jgi:hypothetical protein
MVINKISIVLLTLFLSASPAIAYDNPLKPFRAQYIVEQDDDMIARTSVSLSSAGKNRWLYRSDSEPTGWLASMLGITITQQSEWTWHDGIKTLTYRYDRTGKEKHVHMIFDWQQMKVTNIINGDPWQMEMPDATQDKLGITLALMAHLAQSETDTSFPVADGGKLKTYDYKVLGKQSLDTALGKINTITVSRNKRGRSKAKEATLWLAPDLGYLMVRMEKPDKDGEMAVLKIQSLN